jgi:polar amino acid transport system permease protein
MTDVDTSPPRTPAAIDAVPLRHPWRWVAAVVIIILVVLFVYGAATNDSYRWNVYSEYLFNERVLTVGVLNTLQLTVYSMVLGIVLGVVLAVMRLSANPIFKAVSWVYLWIFRGTPIYVQLVFWGLIPIIRAGISSVPEGQFEASTALGMSWGMAMWRTVLPQAMRVIIPPTGNQVISMLKTTSLVTAVPFTLDLYGITSREIAAREFEPVPLLLVAATWYLVVTSILMVGQYYLERYFARGASRKLTTRQLEALAVAQGIGAGGVGFTGGDGGAGDGGGGS